MKRHKFGIIDLGSNSIRLVVFGIEETGRYQEIHNVKTVARLSNHMDDNQELTEAGIQVVLDTLTSFRQVTVAHKVDEVVGVATAAIRQATNQKQVLKRIEQEAGYSFKVLSEFEEANYGFLSVINSTNIMDGVTIDVGGGSTEITLYEQRVLKHDHSFPFGALTLTRQFISGDKPTAAEFRTLSSFLKKQFETLPWLKNSGYPVIGIGGSARNLCKLHQQANNYPLPNLHQYEMHPVDIQKTNYMLASLPLLKRQKIDGLSKDRADIIIPAIEAIFQLTEIVNTECFFLSQKGLRDGIFYEKMLDELEVDKFPSVTTESVYQLCFEYDMDITHSSRMSSIALTFSKELERVGYFQLTEDDRRLLKLSAQVYSIGEFISTEAKSEHTFYLLTNRMIEGLNHMESLKVAMLASFKSRKTFKTYIKPFKKWFSKEEMIKLELLGAMLRLVYGLNWTKRGAVNHIRILSNTFRKMSIQVEHDQDILFEAQYVTYQKKHLEKVIRKNIIFGFERV